MDGTGRYSEEWVEVGARNGVRRLPGDGYRPPTPPPPPRAPLVGEENLPLPSPPPLPKECTTFRLKNI